MQLPLGAYLRRLVFRWCSVRYVAWRTCQILGLLRRSALSGRRKLLTVPAVVIGSIVLERYVRDRTVWSSHDTGAAAVLFAAGCLALLLWQGRRQVVVEQFTDWTGPDQKPDSRGLATLLVSEIAKLRDVKLPVMVLLGEADTLVGSADQVAAAIPGAKFVKVPGNHLTAVVAPELKRALFSFLDEHSPVPAK